MKNNDKYVEAKKYLQKRYPKELSDKRWNTSDINDDWVTEMMTDFASQSKPQEIKPVDTKTVDAVEFAEWLKVNNHELKLDSGYRSDEHNAKLLNLYKQDIESTFFELLGEPIMGVDTKTVDAVEFLHWVRENDFVYSGGAGWYKDEFDIVIVNTLTYITDAELLNLYIESKK